MRVGYVNMSSQSAAFCPKGLMKEEMSGVTYCKQTYSGSAGHIVTIHLVLATHECVVGYEDTSKE